MNTVRDSYQQQPAALYLAFVLFLCFLVLVPAMGREIEELRAKKRAHLQREIAVVTALMKSFQKGTQSPSPYVATAHTARMSPNRYLLLPPIFKTIARCESGGTQYHKNGSVVRGAVNHNDIGKYQINLTIWGKTARSLGHNVFTEEGNEAMALELYRRHGLQPWYLSRPCWGKKISRL